MVRFESVKYEYASGLEALKGVSLHVGRGEFVAVIGHNGSGKSTLAKHINALFVPTEGDVIVEGMNTRDENCTLAIREHVGMVFQNPDNQMVTTIVEDDVAFGPENLGVPMEELRERVDGALAAVRMTDYVKAAPHALSGGQKQRIAIAGILAMKPDLIVFDEPTAMLDPQGRKEVMDTVLQLRKEGITIVLITHFMEEAAMADRIIVMDDGLVAFEGSPGEVFERSDELLALGLDIPFAVQVSLEARKSGMELGMNLNEEGLVEAICRLYSTN